MFVYRFAYRLLAMKKDTRTLSERLREARAKTNLSQGDVAKAVEMSQPNYSDLEAGNQSGTSKIVEIADVLRVSPRWLAMGAIDDSAPTISELESEIIKIFRENKKMKRLILSPSLAGFLPRNFYSTDLEK